jgi:hypothetical protein
MITLHDLLHVQGRQSGVEVTKPRRSFRRALLGRVGRGTTPARGLGCPQFSNNIREQGSVAQRWVAPVYDISTSSTLVKRCLSHVDASI